MNQILNSKGLCTEQTSYKPCTILAAFKDFLPFRPLSFCLLGFLYRFVYSHFVYICLSIHLAYCSQNKEFS